MQRYMKGMSNGGMLFARDGESLSNHELQAVVPSLFQSEAHESRSARFAPIQTSAVLDGLRREGFAPFFAQQARTRVPGKADFTKHMLRLRHASMRNETGEAFEIILINANDGTSAYHMLPGFFRFVCANGLFVGEKFADIKVRHSGRAADEVIEGAYTVLHEAPKIIDTVAETKAITLSEAERRIMAESVHMLRFPAAYAAPVADAEAEDDAESEVRAAPIPVERLLTPRRWADNSVSGSLWGTFNILQENAIKGGQNGYIEGSNGRVRRQKVRAVTSIDQNRAMNRAMWNLMERMAELKLAA